jgi:hypothetical protein
MNLQDILNLILGFFTSTGSAPSPVAPLQKMITIKRNDTSPAGIFGSISLSWDSWTGVSLENISLAIPTGIYSLVWHVSPHLGNATVPMLVDVVGRTEILLHWGNVESCSEGCILCGTIRDGDAIDTTQAACKILFAKIDAVGIENVKITVE